MLTEPKHCHYHMYVGIQPQNRIIIMATVQETTEQSPAAAAAAAVVTMDHFDFDANKKKFLGYLKFMADLSSAEQKALIDSGMCDIYLNEYV